MTFTHALATNNYGPVKFIVATSAANGTHTTLASAMTAASSGDTIFLRDSVTENVTLTAGVNIAAWMGSTLNTPTITGKLSFSSAGTCTISGIRLTTNSDNFLAVTGSAASIVNLFNCYLNCSNNTGISFTTANTSATINIFNSMGDLGTTGIGLYSMSSTGSMLFNNSYFTNTGVSVTASSNSAGNVTAYYSNFFFPLSTSSGGAVSGNNSQCSTTNTTGITTAGTGASGWSFGSVTAGTASAVSIGSGTTFTCFCTDFGSTNTNAIAGSGTLNYGYLTFNQSSSTIQSTVTLNPFVNTMNGFKSTVTTAPAAGFIGEIITATGSAVSVANNTATNITSINLTAGIWDVSGMCALTNSGNSTVQQCGINVNSASLTGLTNGVNNSANSFVLSGLTVTCTIMPQRVVLSATTTYYLVAFSTFSTGACTGTGKISGTRVG